MATLANTALRRVGWFLGAGGGTGLAPVAPATAGSLLALVIYAFEELQLHRLMANYQPENVRSGRVLERLGFVREGFAQAYLHIDGTWRDHVLTALVRDDPR